MSVGVPPHLHEKQTSASDPAKSVWVSANAGSGKTHVLTQRVVRLLLGGVPPSKILCLTFTKAAAAQMATRVFATLSTWTALDDEALRAAISETGAPAPTPDDLVLARRLFTRTVETPGGLKIQTIHAFCERLLHLFPFEANVPARFEVADEQRTEEMLSQAKRAALAAKKNSEKVALVADIVGHATIHKLIADALRPRIEARRADPDVQSRLARRLNAETLGSVETIRNAMLNGGLPPKDWPGVATVLEAGSTRDQQGAARFREASGLLEVDRAAAMAAYLSVFFGGDGKARSSLMTIALKAAHPEFDQALVTEGARLEILRGDLRTAETIERTTALVDLLDTVIACYEDTKARQGVLDFDDLISRTLTLLERSDSGWVLHKLDAGIDHVLVDEAQDTSQAQWRILERLTAEFSAGEAAREVDRSFFVVGDEKQSIFSFQGAAPLMFDEMRASFERRFRAGRRPFQQVSLKTSFRSVPGILAGVDKIFEIDLHRDGLVQGNDWPTHESLKTTLPGLIEIWPALGATPTAEPQDWTIPVDTPAENAPVNVVAERVARKVATLVAESSPERVHDGRGGVPRPVRPGDILVLVRTRGPFFEAVIRALKRNGVPVAGADRLDVARHIAVMDLVAAGRAALLPDDDLSVACVLKSPLFGLTDDDLIELAPNRSGSLFRALAASGTLAHRDAHATLSQWSSRAVASTPFAFYVELLGRGGGRRQMEARLGPEAHDALDEFLRLALSHEQQGAPSLHSFLSGIEGLESSIRRDMEGPGDLVRVMTVHAAKGLEAKIVFLPDTCAVPAWQLDPNVFDLDKTSGGAPLLVWSPRKNDDPPAVAEAREQARKATLREYRRLLYVALTRAEERLYIAGFYNSKEPPEDCWAAMIDRAFREAERIDAPWGDGDSVRRILTPGTERPVPRATSVAPQATLPIGPAWLRRAVQPETAARPLRPTRLRRGPAVPDDGYGLAYGSALHLLLQYLPGLPPHARTDAGRAYLASQRTVLPQATHEPLLNEALAVLAQPDLAPLFEAGARPEVPIIGRLPTANDRSRDVRGTIDRLAVLPDKVLCADFKTGVPTNPPPEPYLAQMALYRRVLLPLWPDRPLIMLLVWTRGPTIVELSPDLLDRTTDAILASA